MTAGAKQHLLRVNMVNDDCDITYVIKDQLIRSVDIVVSTILIKYGGDFDDETLRYTSEEKKMEYQF